MQVRTMIAAALAAGALALAAPAGAALADPTSDQAVNDYTQRVNDLVNQYEAGATSGRMSQQQLMDQLSAANKQLREAIVATIPGAVVPPQ